MPRANLVDSHQHRDKIIGELLGGRSISAIAADYKIPDDTLYRYRRINLPEKLNRAMIRAQAKAVSENKQAEREDLDPFVGQAMKLYDRFMGIADKVQGADTELKALREARETSRYWAELAGRVGAGAAGTATTNNIMVVMAPAAPDATGPAGGQVIEISAPQSKRPTP
jgi:hypothetical protein